VGRAADTPEHLRDLARLRRVRDRIDREYARPLDVEALARGAHIHRAGRRPAQRLSARRGARDRGDPVVRREAGDQTDQESRSAGAEPRLA
jgi:hypothetical protein